MYCKECGTEIANDGKPCSNCGYKNEIQSTSEVLSKNEEITQNQPVIKSKKSVWSCLAVASFLCSIFTLCTGFDKLLNYDLGEKYPYKAVNAYVGGDAYNYIINGTYATAYFVLTAMLVLAAIGLMILHYLSNKDK